MNQAPVAEKSFRRKFVQLFSGSALAGLASLALMPIQSRLYAPEAFGTFAVFAALSTIFGLVSTLRFDVAIVLVTEQEEAVGLVNLSLIVSLAFALVAGLTMSALAHFEISNYLTGKFILLTTITIFANGAIQTLVNWHSRAQHFEVLGFRNVIERVLVLGTGISIALAGAKIYGLLYAQALGSLFSASYLLWRSDIREIGKGLYLRRGLIRKYSDFPLRYVSSTLLSTGAGNIMSLLFAYFFSRTDVGLFSLASRILEVPINLIANTFSTVYYQTTAQRSLDERRSLFARSLKTLGLIFAAPILILTSAGPYLFGLIFGQEWVMAGTFAQVMGVAMLFRLFFVSQSSLLLVQRRLGIDLWISALTFVAQIGGFALGIATYGTMYSCVVWVSVLGSIVNVFALYSIYKILRHAGANPGHGTSPLQA